MLPAFLTRKPDYELITMVSRDCAEVSALHNTRFPKAWGTGEFHSLLSQEPVFGFVARQTNGKRSIPNKLTLPGFVLARHVAGEAEILTVAVQAKLGRAGLGWRLMQAAMREAHRRGGETMFLEVDGGNVPAVGLYRKLGFETVGERKAYYTDASGAKSTALVMRRDLR
jgi:ribosomal-protein-alanine N-acetyltransferase